MNESNISESGSGSSTERTSDGKEIHFPIFATQQRTREVMDELYGNLNEGEKSQILTNVEVLEMADIELIVTADKPTVNPIGEGVYGKVYSGKFKNEFLVAVKLPRFTKDKFEAWREASMTIHARRKSKGVTKCHGLIGVEDPEGNVVGLALIMEMIGTLSEETMEFCDFADNAESFALGARQYVRILKQITRTVTELHKADIILEDLHGSNVMMSNADGKWKPVFIDFGMAKCSRIFDTYEDYGPPSSVIDHYAPEMYNGSTASFAGDVFCVGRLIENLNGEVDLGLADLASSCTVEDPTVRPTASDVYKILKKKEEFLKDSHCLIL